MTLQKSDLKILKFFWHFRQATLQIFLTHQRSVRFFWHFSTFQRSGFFWRFRKVTDTSETDRKYSSHFSEKCQKILTVLYTSEKCQIFLTILRSDTSERIQEVYDCIYSLQHFCIFLQLMRIFSNGPTPPPIFLQLFLSPSVWSAFFTPCTHTPFRAVQTILPTGPWLRSAGLARREGGVKAALLLRCGCVRTVCWLH